VSGPCLSPSVTGRPLRPATRHSLGEPLPHQQADRPRAPQKAVACATFDFEAMSPLITCGINSAFAELSPTLRQIAHVLRTRSPLNFPRYCYQRNPARLACLIHAASVRSEPESNSPLKTLPRGCGESLRSDFHYLNPLSSIQGCPICNLFSKENRQITHNSIFADLISF
jgi:hypothetical protein